MVDEFNRVDVFGEKTNIEANKQNYINASFINVKLKMFFLKKNRVLWKLKNIKIYLLRHKVL